MKMNNLFINYLENCVNHHSFPLQERGLEMLREAADRFLPGRLEPSEYKVEILLDGDIYEDRIVFTKEEVCQAALELLDMGVGEPEVKVWASVPFTFSKIIEVSFD
jgi:hypothetical protein